MTLLQKLLHLTDFRNPFLRTLVPSVAAAFAIQTVVALPSIALQSERLYDASGSATFLAVSLLSLYLPGARSKVAASVASSGPGVYGVLSRWWPSLLAPFARGAGRAVVLNWRSVAMTAAVGVWSVRLGSYLLSRILSSGHDSRFDSIRKSPPKFAAAWLGQATWVSQCLMPVVAVNSVPALAFAALPAVLATDVLGIALFVGGFGFEIAADRQKSRWLRERREKSHEEDFLTKGLWSRSQYPNYFGECMLWTGIATMAAGVLMTNPVQVGFGLSGGLSGSLLALGLSYASPAFTSFLLLKVTGIPMSEKKYDKRYGDRKDYLVWKQNTPKFFPKIT
ncbi:Uu.00g128150.m01.CDS01 [Anthostomella pinea]|uniref:Uu.00g128150.m01.CDS01 n=1 Tax=Anthostomella pinea TaxID=933095 RepID=A0AAI8VIV4_9PEZI|nr:Uu.00g128150.m01.CDS01 [Anthostomella pinea]